MACPGPTQRSGHAGVKLPVSESGSFGIDQREWIIAGTNIYLYGNTRAGGRFESPALFIPPNGD